MRRCRLTADAPREEEKAGQENVDLSSLTSMLQARWKGGQGGGGSKGEGPRSGQIRSFRISKLDAGDEENRTGACVSAAGHAG